MLAKNKVKPCIYVYISPDSPKKRLHDFFIIYYYSTRILTLVLSVLNVRDNKLFANENFFNSFTSSIFRLFF